MISVWFLLNSALTVAFLLDGRLLPALPTVAWLALLLPVGVWLGERRHRQVDELLFRKTVYGLLLITGGILAGSAALALV